MIDQSYLKGRRHMSISGCQVAAIFVGSPKTLSDARGEWRSSIARDRVYGPAQLENRGFVGDQVTQPYHGSSDLAVCIHSLAHYNFWNETLGMTMQPGAVGENLTFDGWDDSSICVGDVLCVGTARIQVSAPRTPCANQARYVGRPDWVQLTIQELRTGMYARVLEAGTLTAGEPVVLEARPNPGLTIQALNACFYHAHDPALATQFMAADGLMEWWKQRLREKARDLGEGQLAAQ
jgi:MOSC domain-containing protein YiiM